MLKSNKPIPLGLPGPFIGNNNGFLDLSEGGEDSAEALGGGFPAEAADEELALSGVGVGDGADGVEDVGVAEEGGTEDRDELVFGEGFEDFVGVGGGEGAEMGGVGEGGDGEGVAVAFDFALFGEIHGVAE